MLRFDPKDDYLVFDGLEELTLDHATATHIDYSEDKLTRTTSRSVVKNCLIRQMSERLSNTVRQIFERGKSIGNDSIPLVDTVIEIPVQEAESIAITDSITKLDTAGNVLQRFTILAFDKATLGSRWRAACRST